ncbi:MAG: hypothetical protein ACI82A_001463 [Candidatus Azotimanducaceae bacterium]|jgi:hypothetical protein
MTFYLAFELDLERLYVERRYLEIIGGGIKRTIG